uniref:Uncharacterized protein n=1 Tax=Chromera velia CCMP2878 TaxID=1169474 RepID=A0A0K6SAE6_9ALVE|eukprot:Cvel_34959.t2-p1 / transcript=Cvel_34959.t2 / gene=Cvel_34959 / organism=Chromera_velia_CCMP2878 / gene_product=hypothetical protein / transcript_product=hypothetical protein / location=Cvel_scaffold6197:1965-3450(+) / protein_length=152 / sequence_SO=supercontig / SO=protein_coding / is_pseudo=false
MTLNTLKCSVDDEEDDDEEEDKDVDGSELKIPKEEEEDSEKEDKEDSEDEENSGDGTGTILHRQETIEFILAFRPVTLSLRLSLHLSPFLSLSLSIGSCYCCVLTQHTLSLPLPPPCAGIRILSHNRQALGPDIGVGLGRGRVSALPVSLSR